MKSSIKQKNFLTPLIVKYMERNRNIMKPPYSKTPCQFLACLYTGFHCSMIIHCDYFFYIHGASHLIFFWPPNLRHTWLTCVFMYCYWVTETGKEVQKQVVTKQRVFLSVGNQVLIALAIRVSDSQNVLAQCNFHWPNEMPTLPQKNVHNLVITEVQLCVLWCLSFLALVHNFHRITVI